jgi:flagellar hook-length control protein FliK
VAGDTTPATPPAAAAGGSVSATPPAATGAEAPHADGPDADDLTPTGPAAHHTADGAAQAGSPAPHGHGTDADADARRRPDGDGPRTASPAAPATAPAPAASPAPAGPASGAAVGPAPTATVGTPSAPAAPAAPPSSAGVPLAQAVETIRLTVSAARERGITRARIALAPAELGGIEVHLRHSAEGLSARLVAEAPEAAQLLSQAAGDLRRTFEQQGLTLVRIDIATAGDDRTGAGAAGHERREGRRPSGEPAPAAAATTDTPLVDHTIELGNGAIVDVLA